MFTDQVEIHVKSGRGGDGVVHFRKEKFVPRGGPDGGDGGKGGDVVLEVQPTLNTLNFRHKERFSARDGQPGAKQNMTGKSGDDRIVFVPPGTVVSEILAGEEPIDLELIAENLLKEEERPLSERDEVVASVKAVVSSKLWKRMKKAEEALVEVPFSLKIEDEEVSRIISGAIDLAFKEPDGWVIADYKTDKVDGNLESLVTYYKPQVEMYRDFWLKMSGENVKEVGLYFVDTGKWIPIY